MAVNIFRYFSILLTAVFANQTRLNTRGALYLRTPGRASLVGGGSMTIRGSWLAIVLLAVTLLAATACSSSRYPRNGQYGRYGTIYGPQNRSVYGPRNRDYRWERMQRQREAQRRKERRLERRERQRDRDR